MKKLFALMLALVMVLVAAAAFASEEPTTVTPARDAVTEDDGSVTVTNAEQGQTYTLYRLFDADTGANDAITYTLPTGKDSLEGGSRWFKINENGFIEAQDGVTDEWAKDPDAYTWAKEFGQIVGTPITAGTVKWESLPYGYYFVDTTLGAYIGVNSANPKAEIQEKNESPTIDKEITGVNDSDVTLGKGDEDSDPGDGKNEKAIAQVGDPVTYKLTIKAKPGAAGYVVTDTLSAGLTAPAANNVAVSVGTDNCTVAVEGQVITVTIKDEYLATLTTETEITIEYTAILNESAVIGEDGNSNTAKLVWGNDPETNHTEDDAKVFTAQIDILKTDGEERALAGAGFVIKNADGKYYKIDNNIVTWVDDIGDADEHKSGDDGKVPTFTGLKNGEYTIVEKTVPSGYNKLEDQEFKIKDKDYTNDNLKQEATVVNNAGTELPSTGGMGTTIFYVVGGLLIIGAAIVLVARRKAHE